MTEMKPGDIDDVLQKALDNERHKFHNFPCPWCGAKTFEDAGNLCKGIVECPGDTMSKEVFE